MLQSSPIINFNLCDETNSVQRPVKDWNSSCNYIMDHFPSNSHEITDSEQSFDTDDDEEVEIMLSPKVFTIPSHNEIFNSDSSALNTKNDVCCAVLKEFMVTRQCENKAKLWHYRICHRDVRILRNKVYGDLIKGVNITHNSFSGKCLCPYCAMSKSITLPFSKSMTSNVKEKLQLVYTDICGPYRVASKSGYKYFISFIDEYSKMSWIYLLKNKSDAINALKTFHKDISLFYNIPIKAIRSDNGGEFTSNKWKTYCKDNHIVQQFTSRYSPQQNGTAERLNRTLNDMARTSLIASGLHESFWAEALLTSNHVRNRLGTNSLETNTTPFHVWFGYQPNIKYFRVFGCDAFILNDKKDFGKMDVRANPGTFLGYDDNSKSYRILRWDNNQVEKSRNVIFDEFSMSKGKHKIQLLMKNPNLSPTEPFTSVQECFKDYCTNSLSPSETNIPNNTLTNNDNDNSNNAHNNNRDNNSNGSNTRRDRHITFGDNNVQHFNDDDPSRNLSSEFAITRQSTRVATKPEYLTTNKLGNWTNLVHDTDEDDLINDLCCVTLTPRTYKDILKSTDKDKWLQSIHNELQALENLNTWTIVPTPLDKNVISCKWVFRVKEDSSGNPTVYKARLTPRGYEQISGLDYTETFSPVSRHTSLRVILSLAATNDLELHHMDVNNAFPNADLQEEIYMNPPDGYTVPEGKVLKLNKALYGLKQAPRAWNQLIHSFLVSLGFRNTDADSCVYIKSSTSNIMIIGLFVDDLIIACNNVNELNSFKSKISTKFKMKDLGDIKSYLGMEISRNRSSRTITIHQSKYTKNMLEKFRMQDCNPTPVPMIPGTILSISMCPQSQVEEDFMSRIPYRQAVGSLMYLMVATRPDLAYCVNQVAKYMTNPGKAHWQAVKHIFRYVKGTMNLGITYGGTDINNKDVLSMYVDADWANSVDDRKSVTGFVSILNNGPVSWRSTIQRSTAKSSTEAEYYALSEACDEAVWLRKLLRGIKHEQKKATVIFEDNKSCVNLATNPLSHKRTKHIETRYHYLRDIINKGEAVLEYIKGTLNPADIFTKSAKTHKKFLDDRTFIMG